MDQLGGGLVDGPQSLPGGTEAVVDIVQVHPEGLVEAAQEVEHLAPGCQAGAGHRATLAGRGRHVEVPGLVTGQACEHVARSPGETDHETAMLEAAVGV